MPKMFLQFALILYFPILIYSMILLNTPEYFSNYEYKKQYTIEDKKVYEIVAAGAAGGKDVGGDGGRGGIAAGIQDLKKGDILVVYIGSKGENVGDIANDQCGGAGGGGATTVWLGPEGGLLSKILLIGPGGGGGGLSTKPPDPDDKDLTKGFLGDCEGCDDTNKTCFAAAKGRDLEKPVNIINVALNYTYNPSKTENFTRGCFGGYGGGGQGGALRDSSNRTTTGGGGGGGGNRGGEVGTGKDAKSCSAGGPGKAYCKMSHCNVTRVNEREDGYFLIKIHELYKEIPMRDRTNRESPIRVVVDGSKGSRINFSITGQILILITLVILV